MIRNTLALGFIHLKNIVVLSRSHEQAFEISHFV